MPSGSTSQLGELDSASNLFLPSSHPSTSHDGGDNLSKPHSIVDDLDREQRISAVLLEETDEIEDQDSTPATNNTFFYPTAPPVTAPVATCVSEPITNMASSPAALFLGAFMSPKSEPTLLPDDEGSVVEGYTLGPVVGFGAFSTIRKAYSVSGGTVAIKIVRRSDLVYTGHAPAERRKLEREEAVWASLSHEHILPLFATVHTAYADFFITPYCPAGSLYDILKRDGSPALPQDEAGMMFRQVVRGLRYLHEDAMFVHRDMKLENVLVDESGVCRIGDFGLSVKIGPQGQGEDEDEGAVILDDEVDVPDTNLGYNQVHRAFSLTLPKRPARITSNLNPISRHHSARRSASNTQTSHVHQPGSLPYAAPELLLPQSAELSPPHPSQDIWALGVMLYALLAGHLPFNDSFEPRLQMKILNGAFNLPKDIGRGAERILLGCLERNVSKRWSAAMVDEVAWGVGWGSEGDSATPEGENSAFRFDQQEADSESEPYQNILETIDSDEEPDWENEERVPRAAMEAATRRSKSRVKRSLSRAPLTQRYTQRNGSHSRASSPLRTSTTTSSFLDPGSVCHSPTRVRSPSRYYETDSRSRSVSRPRGRRPNKSFSYLPSRSPSPSMVPTTPIDLGSHILARLHLEDHPEELELDPAPPRRGRTMFATGFTTEAANEYEYECDDECSVLRSRPMAEVDRDQDFKPTVVRAVSASSLAGRWRKAFGSGELAGGNSSSSSSSCRSKSRESFNARRLYPSVAPAAPASMSSVLATGEMDGVWKGGKDGDATIRKSVGRAGSAGSLKQLWGAESLQLPSMGPVGAKGAKGILAALSGTVTPANVISRSRSAEVPLVEEAASA